MFRLERGLPINKLRVITLVLVTATQMMLHAQEPVRTIHVFVALADNKNQGIVPVAAILGNGDDPARNLYWGSAYGVKTFFSHSADWQLLVSGQKPKAEVLERCIFKHRTQNVFLIADAYQGARIKQTIVDFLDASAGSSREAVPIKFGSQAISLAGRG